MSTTPPSPAAAAARAVSPAPASSAPPVVAPRKPRLTLESIVSGKIKSPDKVTVVGLEGVGKTTFGASAERPVFICAEDGTDELDARRFPTPPDLTMLDVYDAIAALRTGTHEYRTLVIDTVDWLEPVLIRAVCERNKWMKNVEGVNVPDVEAPGFGKGWEAVADEWRKFLAALDGLRSARGMAIVLLGHSVLKRWNNPNDEDYERFECSISKKGWALLRQWSKCVLFAAHEEIVSKKSKHSKAKGSYTGRRVAFTERTAAYDAKNRYGLPPLIDLSWNEYATLRDKSNESDENEIKSEINGLVATLALPADEAEKVSAYVTKYQGNVAALRAMLHRMEQRLVAKTTAESDAQTSQEGK